MDQKKQPERMCSVCRVKADKTRLIRVVKLNSGEIIIDHTHKANGRGLYICNNETCIKKAIKTKALNRGFKKDVDPDIYDKLGELYE